MPEIRGKIGTGTVRMFIDESSLDLLNKAAEEEKRDMAGYELTEALIQAAKKMGHKRDIPNQFVQSFLAARRKKDR